MNRPRFVWADDSETSLRSPPPHSWLLQPMLFYRLGKKCGEKTSLAIGEAMAIDHDCEGCRVDDEGAGTNAQLAKR